MDTSLYSEAEKVAGISSVLVFPGITIIQGKNSIEYWNIFHNPSYYLY